MTTTEGEEPHLTAFDEISENAVTFDDTTTDIYHQSRDARFSHFDNMDLDELDEFGRKTCAIFNFSPVKSMERCILDMVHYPRFSYQQKLDFAMTLLYSETSGKKEGVACLWMLVQVVESFKNLPFIVQIDLLSKLITMGNDVDSYSDFIHGYFTSAETRFPLSIRYKGIHQLSQLIPEIKSRCFMTIIDAWNNSDKEEPELEYIIMACHYLTIQESEQNYYASILYSIAKNPHYERRYRADAADCLIRAKNTPIYTLEAGFILRELGGGQNIYENMENVHVQEIQDGIIELIKYLSVYNSKSRSFEEYTQYYMSIATPEDRFVVARAFNRIEVDHSLTNTHSLKSIFKMVCAHIESNEEHKEELEKRMIEELVDMADTCSTGYCSRLVNVLSGFVDANIQGVAISWKDQIRANLMGRLNAELRKDDDQAEILEQITNPSILDRTKYLEFIRKHISRIKEEMYGEFKDHISDQEWDLYFREAMAFYEQ